MLNKRLHNDEQRTTSLWNTWELNFLFFLLQSTSESEINWRLNTFTIKINENFSFFGNSNKDQRPDGWVHHPELEDKEVVIFSSPTNSQRASCQKKGQKSIFICRWKTYANAWKFDRFQQWDDRLIFLFDEIHKKNGESISFVFSVPIVGVSFRFFSKNPKWTKSKSILTWCSCFLFLWCVEIVVGIWNKKKVKRTEEKKRFPVVSSDLTVEKKTSFSLLRRFRTTQNSKRKIDVELKFLFGRPTKTNLHFRNNSTTRLVRVFPFFSSSSRTKFIAKRRNESFSREKKKSCKFKIRRTTSICHCKVSMMFSGEKNRFEKIFLQFVFLVAMTNGQSKTFRFVLRVKRKTHSIFLDCSTRNPCGSNGYCVDDVNGDSTCQCKFWWNGTLCNERQ